ncbi:UPF0149 family protein [Aquincola sp. MAHUQ-54]|uniref:UPF0149 family protein n=1 Tax=Aquincola agrisoli TaxID=3119538 RepID=A0AAW9QJ34_9BURK
MKLDLTDDELDELDTLLTQTPEPAEPLDAIMLDGYLCGVLVQPRVVPKAEWLPPIFDLETGRLPEGVDPAWLARCETLIERRYAALNAALAEDGWFDPLVVDLDRAAPASEYDPVQSEASRTLMPWVAGFHWALERFPALFDVADDAIALALARLYRHLPAETDEDRELNETLERDHPLATVDEAIEDLVATVMELWDLTSKQRFHVDTVRREEPKVGRNDPCPCGSGRKFKQCHGRG